MGASGRPPLRKSLVHALSSQSLAGELCARGIDCTQSTESTATKIIDNFGHPPLPSRRSMFDDPAGSPRSSLGIFEIAVDEPDEGS